MAFFALHLIIVVVFPVGDPLDGDIEIDFLRLQKGVVEILGVVLGPGFHDRWELPYPECAHVGETAFAAQPHRVFAQRRIRSDGNDCLHTVVILPGGEGFHRQALVVEQEFLRILQSLAVESDFNLGTKLAATGFNPRQFGAEAVGKKGREQKQDQRASHGDH